MSEAITVSALNAYVRAVLDADPVISGLLVVGEISNLNINRTSGHAYFSLKDSGASVRAVMFSRYQSALRFLPKDGMRVTVRASASLYERDGTFQLMVFEMYPAGEGVLAQQLERLKTQLESEGLFAQSRKRPLPEFPRSIAVISSATGAAIRDIISVVSRRYPLAVLLHYHTSVQGLAAEHELVEAITAVEREKKADLVIIARGGGSKEDLFVFNSEKVVRAASALSVPFISAVGHETDFTLLDFASDVRAPTPSAAAELAVPDAAALLSRAYASALFCYEACQDKLMKLRGSAASMLEETVSSAQDKLYKLSELLAQKSGLVNSLSPLAVTARGYAAVLKDGTKAAYGEISVGDEVELLFMEGRARCAVTEKHDEKIGE